MKTSSKKLDKCQVQIDVVLDGADMKKTIENVERAFMREARLPGFRPGKVPLAVIRREFAPQLEAETRRAAIEKNIPGAIEQEKLDAIAVVEVKDVKTGAEGGSFTAIVDVKPVFKLPVYKGLKISRNDTTVKDEEVAERLESLRAAYAKYEDAKEGDVAAKGDFVQISYSGTIDGKPIADEFPEAKIVAGAEGFWTQIEEGRFLPEILDALEGMKPGEEKEGVAVKFAKEGAPEGLGGKNAVYKVALKTVRKQIKPGDEELAKLMNSESIEKATADIREKMQKQADDREAMRREDEAMELLLKKCDFDLPASQVERATDAHLARLQKRAEQSGIDASYFRDNKDKIYSDAYEAAARQIRGWYILDAIAKAEKIEAGEDELARKALEFVLANAK